MEIKDKRIALRFKLLGPAYRTPKQWYRPIYFLGQKAEQLVCKFHKFRGIKANPYITDNYKEILWWIRKNITFN